jgi:hypothetical protein
MIKTLADLTQAINELPLEAFADHVATSKASGAIFTRLREYENSTLYQAYLDRQNDERTQRQKNDAKVAKARAKWARENIKKGMFVKVVGARDGVGLREVISVEMDCVVCRQWLPHRWRHNYWVKDPSFMKAEWHPANQMTTHEFSKVAGYFVQDINLRYWLKKVV